MQMEESYSSYRRCQQVLGFVVVRAAVFYFHVLHCASTVTSVEDQPLRDAYEWAAGYSLSTFADIAPNPFQLALATKSTRLICTGCGL
jgi:hypothetical protein